MSRWLPALAAFALMSAGCSPKPDAAALNPSGFLSSTEIDEASGIAHSRRSSDMLWTHNDSGNQPVLYAIGTDGRLRGKVRIKGVKNVDWEDIAAFSLDGQSWLLIADVGDNGGRRRDCVLHVIAEPDIASLTPEREQVVEVAWSIPIKYPDQPHDCEAVAVDVRERRVYLLGKRSHPSPLWALPLLPDYSGQPVLAQEVAQVDGIPQPTSEQRAFPFSTGRWRGQPTSMDISADGLYAAVLSYGDVMVFPRRPGESWPTAFAREPVLLPPHGLEQAEAVCFSPDGRALFVVEEKLHSALLRYDLDDAQLHP